MGPLASGDAQPVEYARLALELVGAEWPDLDFGILQDLVEGRVGPLSPVGQAKLFFTQEVSGEPPYRTLSDPWLFEKLVVAFSGGVPDFEAWQTPGTADVAEAVYRLQELKGEEFYLPPEVWRYVAACLVHDGCWLAPPGLEEADGPIQLYMEQRGVRLPDRSEVQGSPSVDVRNQLQIWRAVADRMR